MGIYHSAAQLVGHTPLEVCGGVLLGLIMVLIMA